jgi:hypothetical protein
MRASEITPEYLYHVTFTRRIPKIKKEGILTGKRANWSKAISGAKYGKGEVNAFDNFNDACRWAFKMDWEFFSKSGSGNISIIKFRPSPYQWSVDKESDPLSQSSYKGDWLKSTLPVRPENIVSVTPFTHEILKKELM